MKLLCCYECRDVLGLSRTWRNCDCGQTGGGVKPDGDTILIAGPCFVIGLSNKLRARAVRRGEAWLYDDTNGKVERMIENRGDWPSRPVFTPTFRMLEPMQ
jgi:hypothetical protein